jgi:hypothetical protein
MHKLTYKVIVYYAQGHPTDAPGDFQDTVAVNESCTRSHIK